MFAVAIGLSIVGAIFSMLRGRRYVHADDVEVVHADHEHRGDAAIASGAVPGELALQDDRT